jgi:hypothetical protein
MIGTEIYIRKAFSVEVFHVISFVHQDMETVITYYVRANSNRNNFYSNTFNSLILMTRRKLKEKNQKRIPHSGSSSKEYTPLGS